MCAAATLALLSRTTASEPPRKYQEHIVDRELGVVSCQFSGRSLFSATFRYALISLLEIAGSEEGANTAVIASRHRIPGTYLANVLRELRRLGVIVSQKGRRGGYLLAKPPEQIDLLFIQQGLAGASEPIAAAEAEAGVAVVWLESFESRWRRELAATSLREVLQFAGNEAPPAVSPPEAPSR